MRVNILAHLDGHTSGCGYKYVVTKSNGYGCGWRAYRTAKGLKRFLDAFGLKIDPALTEINDYRAQGHGRTMLMRTYEKEVVDTSTCLFWNLDEIPLQAKPFVDLCNGSYVRCFIYDEGDKVTFYRPNPNAKEVYGLFGLEVNLDEIS